jgi:hypothetical protein
VSLLVGMVRLRPWATELACRFCLNLDSDEPLGCVSCGKILNTEICAKCGRDAVPHWGNSWDDVASDCAYPLQADPGDGYYCVPCAEDYDQDAIESEAEEMGWEQEPPY